MATWLVLGGARSGKSAHAERIAVASGQRLCFLATAHAGDGEMAARIETHRARRGEEWRTIEEPLDIAPAILDAAGPAGCVLVDCLTLWLSNLMAAERDVGAAGDGLVAALRAARGTVVLVANEVGAGIVPDNALVRTFRDAAGQLNQQVAEAASDVVLVAAGLPLPLKRDGQRLHD